jgi:hypothetical protein
VRKSSGRTTEHAAPAAAEPAVHRKAEERKTTERAAPTAAESAVQRKAEEMKTTVSPEAWLDRDSKMSSFFSLRC